METSRKRREVNKTDTIKKDGKPGNNYGITTVVTKG